MIGGGEVLVDAATMHAVRVGRVCGIYDDPLDPAHYRQWRAGITAQCVDPEPPRSNGIKPLAAKVRNRLPVAMLVRNAKGNVTETGFERVARRGRLPAWISS